MNHPTRTTTKQLVALQGYFPKPKRKLHPLFILAFIIATTITIYLLNK